MVNIRKRGKVYQYQFEIAKVEGKRKYISKSGFKTRNEALMAGMKAYDEYLNGGVTKDSQMSYELEPIKNEYGKINEYKIVEGKYKNLKSVEMVFTKNNGLYVGTDIIKYPFKIIHNELGIKNCRFYDLRGSYATKILRNGAEIRDVADILGHSRIETTENYYISSSEKTRKEANDMLEEIMKSDVINDIMNY